MSPDWPPTHPGSLAAARARLAAVRPASYARTRNALDGAVTGLSPYLTHGFLRIESVWAELQARHGLTLDHKLGYELGWRAYFRHVWAHRGDGILLSLHPGPLPDAAYQRVLPDDVREARTGLPVIDQAITQLYQQGWLHNHARMWLASYLVHLRKLHWRVGADWMLAHLLDGDLASNHLSWQWVAGTGSAKPYLFNADNVARYAPAGWHSPGSAIDTCYERLDGLARRPEAAPAEPGAQAVTGCAEPSTSASPPPALAAAWHLVPPDPAQVAGRRVWLLHAWQLGQAEPPAGLWPDDGVPVQALVVLDAGFHRRWPWAEGRWRFVGERLQALGLPVWWGEADALATALQSAHAVQGLWDPHLAPPLARLASRRPDPPLFREVAEPCRSFSRWWQQVQRP